MKFAKLAAALIVLATTSTALVAASVPATDTVKGAGSQYAYAKVVRYLKYAD